MKIAICDDDKSFIKDFSDRIRAYHSVQMVDCFTDYRFLESELVGEEYDVIMMDIDWKQSEENGIDLSARLSEKHSPAKIVYVSSYAEKYIEQTYLKKSNVVAFLVKPVKQESLDACMSLLENLLNTEENEYIYISEKGRKIRIEISSILYAESTDHYIDVFTSDEIYHIQGKLSDFEKRTPDNFVRCHRGFLINLNHIHKFSASELIMNNRVTIPIGRKYSEEFRAAYVKYLADKM